MSADTLAILFVVLVIAVALGNLLGEFIFHVLHQDDGDDE